MRSNYPPLPGTGPIDPRFQNGDLVRYEAGATALFRITDVYRNYGGERSYRYYGVHCMGGIVGRYDFQLEKASDKDEETWFECEKWRKP